MILNRFPRIAKGIKRTNPQANEIAMQIIVLKGPATPARALLRPTNGMVSWIAFAAIPSWLDDS